MRTSNSGLVALIVALAGGFLYGLWKLYDLRFEVGDIYPPYSSLRADPMGAKALYESLEQIPGISAARNYREVASLPKSRITVLFLGIDPFAFQASPNDQLTDYEALARAGARVVIAMRPVRRLLELAMKKGEKSPEPSPLEKRWGVRFEYITHSLNDAAEDESAEPKVTALYFRYQGKALSRIERPFGSGAVVLVANCYPFSNEALASDRDTKLLAFALGSSHSIIFDEHHLGLTESGGVVTLARKYHLEGLAAVLLALLALFIWKNSTSFLPARTEPARSEDSVAAKDTASGLANLLRRNIPPKELATICVNQWEASQHGGRFYSQAKIEQVRRLAGGHGDVVDAYRKISRIVSKRNSSNRSEA